MRLTDILTEDRVLVVRHEDGIKAKSEVIETLAKLLARGTGREPEAIHKVLADREEQQSTGIGDGVAIPHGSVDALAHQTAAVLLCPDGVEFQSIDGRPASIVVGVVGPRRATGEHLRMLARVSRLLRNSAFREKLLAAPKGSDAYFIIHREEESRP